MYYGSVPTSKRYHRVEAARVQTNSWVTQNVVDLSLGVEFSPHLETEKYVVDVCCKFRHAYALKELAHDFHMA